MRPRPALLIPIFAALVSAGAPSVAAAQSDLDAFMAEVLARRDENWKKLQQYVLDERETAEVLGPGGVRLYGLEREYTWYIRDGIFVRSPLRSDGVALSEDERLKYENEWIERERRREARERGRGRADDHPEAKDGSADPAPAPSGTETEALLRLAKEPRFVSAAYFMKFKFEEGRYAFVGREDYEGREVLRIEYYPTRLFEDDRKEDGEAEGRAGQAERTRRDAERDREDEIEGRIQRQMNKVSLITLWVEPAAKQIVKYTFENVAMDFLPGRWFVRVDDLEASMAMGEPFPGVWLPRRIDGHGEILLASGTFGVRYRVEYHDYREADVKTRLR